MATTITVNRGAEEIKWPPKCVCCGGVDETDVEVVVPFTTDERRDLSEIVTADVPYCYDCLAHEQVGLATIQWIALFVAVAFITPALVVYEHTNAAATFAAGVLLLAAAIVVDRSRARRAMKPACARVRSPYRFVHPCSMNVTTIEFANDSFARAYRALNVGGYYEE